MTLKKKTTTDKAKTTAASEKAKREALAAKTDNTGRPAAKRSRAAKEAMEQATHLAGAEQQPEQGAGTEVTSEEIIAEVKPAAITADQRKRHAEFNRSMKSRHLAMFSLSDWIAEGEPTADDFLARFAKPSKKRSAAKAGERGAAWAKESVKGERADAVLAKLKEGTRERPVLAAKQLSDQERAIARRLFAHDLIRRDNFEQGIGYFAG